MRRFVAVLAGLTLTLCTTAPAIAHQLTRDELHQVGFQQHQGDSVPLDLAFNDEYGTRVTLANYFTSRPVILTLNYFHCQNLCSLELQGLVDGLNGVPFTLGDQYTLLTVSFDPRETPHDASTARFRAMRGYIHPEATATWHVLTTSDQSAIDRLTEAVGFGYVYDPQEDDYAHPAGVVVLTPTGRISRYIYGLDYSANDLRLGLVEAAANRIGSLVDQVLLVCYHYDAVTGRYTPLVMSILSAAAGLTVLIVGVVLFMMFRADLRKRPSAGEA
jgi:protein SCO1/2